MPAIKSGDLFLTEVQITDGIKVKQAEDIEKAKMCIDNAEKNCLISNSIKTDVKLIPEINTAF